MHEFIFWVRFASIVCTPICATLHCSVPLKWRRDKTVWDNFRLCCAREVNSNAHTIIFSYGGNNVLKWWKTDGEKRARKIRLSESLLQYRECRREFDRVKRVLAWKHFLKMNVENEQRIQCALKSSSALFWCHLFCSVIGQSLNCWKKIIKILNGEHSAVFFWTIYQQ